MILQVVCKRVGDRVLEALQLFELLAAFVLARADDLVDAVLAGFPKLFRCRSTTPS